jgi:hypothetical protein
VRSEISTRISIAIVIIVVVAGIAAAEPELQRGTVVFAEWFENQWYNGTVEEPCDDGYRILAETGEIKCVPLDGLVLDVVPEAEDVDTGVAVLAQWGAGLFYPGTVSAINGDSYDIQYDDGDRSTVRLDQLRIRDNLGVGGARVVALAEAVTVEDPIVIQRSGSEWAEIETDGTLWVNGSVVGEITSDIEVYRDGRMMGEVDSDGTIWVGDTRAGEIEPNGRFWRGSSPIGSIVVNGDLYLSGSKWGAADSSLLSFNSQRVVAAILVFFAPDYGFNP